MCDYDSLTQDEKDNYSKLIKDCAINFGGVNFFLQLLEGIRKEKPHPLINSKNEFSFSKGGIYWNKTIFKDKLTLLVETRKDESVRGNFLLDEKDKKYKKVLNLVKTLAPIEFELRGKNMEKSQIIKAFDKIDDKTSKLNPLFDAIFFCSVGTIKKFLN